MTYYVVFVSYCVIDWHGEAYWVSQEGVIGIIYTSAQNISF
jgi:hypothetical protein